MNQTLSLAGHGFYVWSAYGVFALAIAIELLALRRRRRAALRARTESKEDLIS